MDDQNCFHHLCMTTFGGKAYVHICKVCNKEYKSPFCTEIVSICQRCQESEVNKYYTPTTINELN